MGAQPDEQHDQELLEERLTHTARAPDSPVR